MASMKDLIKRKQGEMEAKKASNLKTQRSGPGKNKYRILPAWREQNEFEKSEDIPAPFWHDFSLHWIKQEIGGKPVVVYPCLEKTFGKPCDICGAIEQAIVGSDDEDFKRLVKESASRQSYLMNALHLNGDEPDEPVILEVGQTVFDQICGLIEEYEDITDLEDGIDIIIHRQGTGFDTKYNVLVAKKSNPVDKSVLDKLHDLDAAVSQENATRHQTALSKIGEITGVLPTPTRKIAPPKSKLADEDIEDAEFVDADDELETAMNGTDDDADIDDLLDDDDLLDELNELEG